MHCGWLQKNEETQGLAAQKLRCLGGEAERRHVWFYAVGGGNRSGVIGSKVRGNV